MLKEISAGIIIYRYAERTIDHAKRGRKTEEWPKFLILYHGRGYWNFPKGKIELEEKSFQTAVREIKEETGLNRSDLKFNQSFKVYEKFTFWRPAKRDLSHAQRGEKTEGRSQMVFKTVIFYLAETKKIQISLSSGHEEGYGWFTYREALKILSKHKDSQRVLRQAHETLQK